MKIIYTNKIIIKMINFDKNSELKKTLVQKLDGYDTNTYLLRCSYSLIF